MAGQFLTTQIENQKSVGTTGTAQTTVTVDLPRSNFLSSVEAKLHLVGVDTPTLTIDRVRVIANGSQAIVDLTGGQLRAINKFEHGSMLDGAATSTTDLEARFFLSFGRFRRDELVVLPAKIFKSLQLQITYTPGAGTSLSAQNLSVSAEEYVSDDDPRGKMVRTLSTISSVAAVASALTRVRFPLGQRLRSIYLHADDPDNISMDGGATQYTDQVRVLVNNGSVIPFSAKASAIETQNQMSYRFDDGAVPGADGSLSDAAVATGSTARMLKIDFDLAEDLRGMIDTTEINELSLEYKAGAGGTSGDVQIITEEIRSVT